MLTIDTNSRVLLSDNEKLQLAQLEATINSGIKAFFEVGKALSVIRDNRLHREQHESFETYCQQRWDLGRSQIYRLLDAAKIVADLSPIGDVGDSLPLPLNEAQCRPLKKIPSEKRFEAWKEIIQTAPNGKVTAVHAEDVLEVNKLIDDRNYRYRKAQKMFSSAVAHGVSIRDRNGASVIFKHWQDKKKKPISKQQKAILKDDIEEFCRQFKEADEKNNELQADNPKKQQEEEEEQFQVEAEEERRYLAEFTVDEFIEILRGMPVEYLSELAQVDWGKEAEKNSSALLAELS